MRPQRLWRSSRKAFLRTEMCELWQTLGICAHDRLAAHNRSAGSASMKLPIMIHEYTYYVHYQRVLMCRRRSLN